MSEPASTSGEFEQSQFVGERSQPAVIAAHDRIVDLEIEAQRRELEVRFSYEAALEERLLDFQHQIESLHAHIGAREQHFSVERQGLMASSTAERDQVLLAQQARDDARRERDDADNGREFAQRERAPVPKRERDDVQRELDAERAGSPTGSHNA